MDGIMDHKKALITRSRFFPRHPPDDKDSEPASRIQDHLLSAIEDAFPLARYITLLHPPTPPLLPRPEDHPRPSLHGPLSSSRYLQAALGSKV